MFILPALREIVTLEGKNLIVEDEIRNLSGLFVAHVVLELSSIYELATATNGLNDAEPSLIDGSFHYPTNKAHGNWVAGSGESCNH